NLVYHSKTKHIAIRHHFIRDAYEKKLIQVLKIHTDDNVADLLTKAFDVSRGLLVVRESLGRVIDGTEALQLSTLFILWLDTVSTDSAKLLPLGKVCTALETLKKNTAKALISLLTTISLSTTMAVLDSCPKHNMVACLEKSEGNAEFHEIIDFLKRSSIHHALTAHRSDLLFDDADGIDSLPNPAIFDAIQLMGQIEGTDEQNEGTEEQIESTDGQRKGTEDHTEEGSATQATQTPTSTIFGDDEDETIAKVLLNMSQAKAVSREKEKGVELKDIEETDRPRPTSTRSLLTLKPLPKIDPKDKGKKKIEEEDESESESDGIPEAEKKFKQLESDERMAGSTEKRIEADRLLAEKLQEQEREQFTIEERAKFLHDTIAAQRKFLAQQRSEAIRNRPPTKNQLRNQMMTYLKHVGNFKHAELKIKKFEEVQALYEKIKRLDEDFISIGSVEDERLIKRMNEKGFDSLRSIWSRRREERKNECQGKERFSVSENTSEDDSEKENDELRLHLTIALDEEKEVDYEILDRKYPIKEWRTEYCVCSIFGFVGVGGSESGSMRFGRVSELSRGGGGIEPVRVLRGCRHADSQDEIPKVFDRVLWGAPYDGFVQSPVDEDEFLRISIPFEKESMVANAEVKELELKNSLVLANHYRTNGLQSPCLLA
ncbi:hypothetical protein Tco_1303512, partial [Tanacetum coccineum]